jgi:hypothetical protein
MMSLLLPNGSQTTSILPMQSPGFTRSCRSPLISPRYLYQSSGSWVPDKSYTKVGDKDTIIQISYVNQAQHPHRKEKRCTYSCEARPQPSVHEDYSHMMRSTIINIILKYLSSIPNSITMLPIAMISRLKLVSMTMDMERDEMAAAEQWFPLLRCHYGMDQRWLSSVMSPSSLFVAAVLRNIYGSPMHVKCMHDLYTLLGHTLINLIV